MELAILLSLAASVCTATSSVCQRLGARHLERCGEMRGLDALLVFRLARQPTWLLGFACMIAGFAFQVAALRLGPLTLVQPILAIELLFVFGYLALRAGKVRGRTRWREWGAAILLGIFVFQERLATSPAAMAAEVAGLIVLALGVWTLSGSELITHTTQPRRPEAGEATNRELTRRSG
jgi:hypothetical protein